MENELNKEEADSEAAGDNVDDGLDMGAWEEDVDGDREEPETRAQPPADSPISHPRTSLPPVSQPGASAEAAQRATG